jgi:hypothetical protein
MRSYGFAYAWSSKDRKKCEPSAHLANNQMVASSAVHSLLDWTRWGLGDLGDLGEFQGAFRECPAAFWLRPGWLGALPAADFPQARARSVVNRHCQC